MGQPSPVRAPLPPICRLSDERWTMAETMLKEHDPPAERGPDQMSEICPIMGRSEGPLRLEQPYRVALISRPVPKLTSRVSHEQMGFKTIPW